MDQNDFASINIFPETRGNLAHARRTSGPEWTSPFGNIGALLTLRAAQTPAKNFLTYYDDNGLAATYTFAEFHDRVRRLARLLTEQMGVTTGDRIATLCVNDARTVLIYFSAWLLGATVVPVNCTEDDDRVAYILANSQAKVACVTSDQIPRLEALGRAIQEQGSAVPPSFEVDAQGGVFDARIAATDPLATLPDLGPETECLIVYTSGTTGAPKGVVLEQSTLLSDDESIDARHRFAPDDRAMCV